MDRVREPGEVRATNFMSTPCSSSDDAVSVETELHHRFRRRRVNRINARREFFYATSRRGLRSLKDIAGNPRIFTEEPEAEQARLSLEEARICRMLRGSC